MIELGSGTAALLLLLGGLVALDGTSTGQFMISRPLIAASLAGWIVGAPMQGAWIGLLLEALHLSVLPVGAARYPEAGPAAVAAGAVYASGPPAPSVLLTVVLFALGWEWVSGYSVRLLRNVNGRFLAVAESVTELEPARLVRLHLAGIVLDFTRGLLLVGAGIGIAALAVGIALDFWTAGERIPQLLIAGALVTALAGASGLFGGRRRRALFVLGVAAGLALGGLA